jgi:uncharacterized protein YutE (UPF0331/DUF86 family)
MTDAGLVAKKLARIEGCLRDLDAVDPDVLATDVVQERFAEHTLQIAIQAAVDVAAHIVADARLGDAATNHALFDLLARNGWLDAAQVQVMHRMVGFRNVLVHGYDDVDLRVVADAVRHRRGDLQAFVDAIRARLAAGA